MTIYEKYVRGSDNKWIFVGILDENQFHRDDKFLESEKLSRGFIYRTYKWLTGKTEEVRYKEFKDN